MSHYVILWSWSEQGIEKIKQSPNRADHFKQVCNNNGVKINGIYYTFGQYDVVTIVEAPDDTILISTLLSLETDGAAKSTTLKAFTYEEAKKIIESL